MNKSSDANFSASFAPSISGIPIVSVQPFTAIIPLIESTEMITLCFPIVSTNSCKNSVLRIFPCARCSSVAQANEPIITFSAPREINSFACFTVLIPPPTRTFPFRKSDFKSSVFTVEDFPFSSVWIFPSAASKSITAVSPYLLNSLIIWSAFVRSRTLSFPFLS